MSDSTEQEIETLADGLASPFWQWLSAKATREWGPAGLTFQAAVQAAAKDASAVVELQKVIHTQQEVLKLLASPKDRLDALRGQLAARVGVVAGGSRRGPGL